MLQGLCEAQEAAPSPTVSGRRRRWTLSSAGLREGSLRIKHANSSFARRLAMGALRRHNPGQGSPSCRPARSPPPVFRGSSRLVTVLLKTLIFYK